MNATPASRLGWYARRIARMSPAEVAWWGRDQVLQAAWSRRQVTREHLVGADTSPKAVVSWQAVSWNASGVYPGKTPGIRAEAR